MITMKKKIFMLILSFLLILTIVEAQETETNSEKVDLFFFYINSCPHCHEAMPIINEFEYEYPRLNVTKYEVSTEKNQTIFHNVMVEHNTVIQGVPTIVVEDEVFVGFSPGVTDKKIEEKIKSCIEKCEYNETSDVYRLPIIGEVDTSKISLPLFTVVIGLLDGINPCAMWVLMFLLSLLIHAKSRKRMLFIGTIFCFTSGFVYFLFMTAWFNLFSVLGYKQIFTTLLGLLAIIVGIVNIKEFFFFKKGISLTIPDKYKPKLFKKMRKVVNESNLILAFFGTLTLAFFVNLIELGCTAGLPAIFTKVLTLQKVPIALKYTYLALYNLAYIVPLIVIVFIFAFTMGKKKLSKKEGRLLKLISGLLIFTLGFIMLFKPQLLVFG